MYILRQIDQKLHEKINKGKSILFLGPRQTGKTTLLSHFQPDLSLSFIVPKVRVRYEADPTLLIQELDALAKRLQRAPLVILDEIQKVPELMDCVQDILDRKKAQFILTGSSARKLRHGKNINLLPGRVLLLYLDPLSITEIINATQHPGNIEDYLQYGTLPNIWQTQEIDEREEALEAYVALYLEEEIRREAAVRNLGHFARFLELAAAESGCIVNLSKLSQEIGVSHTTISAYYRLLEDCLIVEKIEPYVKTKTRRKLSKTPKYVFFDLGVRRVAAREDLNPPTKYKGHLFEQWVGLEIIRLLRTQPSRITLHYWRDLSGAEVDWVIKNDTQLIPIEVKWTSSPTLSDSKHLQIFLQEYSEADTGFIICQTPRAFQITDKIIALPWWEIHLVLKN